MALVENTAVRTATNIGLAWNEGAANGGTPVIDYRVWYDQAIGVWVELNSGLIVREYLVSSLIIGATYSFKV